MRSNNIIFSVLLMAVGVREIEPSKDAMKYITSGFVKVLEECKKEVSGGVYGSRKIYVSCFLLSVFFKVLNFSSHFIFIRFNIFWNKMQKRGAIPFIISRVTHS